MKILQTTYPTLTIAETIAEKLIHLNLGACVQIFPEVKSVYKWEGKIQKDSEFLMQIKTIEKHVSTVIEIVSESHPYKVPEIIELDGKILNQHYKKWFNQSLKTE